MSTRGNLPSTSFIAALEHLYRRIGRAYRRAGRQAFEIDAALWSAAAVWREARSTP